jgi:long-chain acyl-CoA synthetase
MKILERLTETWAGIEYPFLIHEGTELRFSEISSRNQIDLSTIRSGDVVAIVGDFNPESILTFLRLIDLGAIVVPLTVATAPEHEYFFESALVDVVIQDGGVRRRAHGQSHELIAALRSRRHAGLVLFSSGTTGRPKAILHDLTLFLKRFETARPSLRTVSFLLFDHIGGIYTTRESSSPRTAGPSSRFSRPAEDMKWRFFRRLLRSCGSC